MDASALEDDKKIIYDESFAKIKDERFGFKLPRGVKKEKPVAVETNAGGFGGDGGGAAWGGG